MMTFRLRCIHNNGYELPLDESRVTIGKRGVLTLQVEREAIEQMGNFPTRGEESAFLSSRSAQVRECC